ncbi:hypothetical protein [Shimia sp.]|uniref:hypothetical protein n=1 Tax=Shimia sp. TaxID=1954381 RepID=UPI003BAAAC24
MNKLVLGFVVAVLFVVVWIATLPDERPPRWGEVCARHEYFTTLVPIFNGKSTTMVPQQQARCVLRERVCLPAGKDYTGPSTSCS